MNILGTEIEAGTRERVWSEMVRSCVRPPDMSDRKVEKLKALLWDDEDFWCDLLCRHGLRDTCLRDLPEETREHAIGNFWGQLSEAWWRENRKDADKELVERASNTATEIDQLKAECERLRKKCKRHKAVVGVEKKDWPRGVVPVSVAAVRDKDTRSYKKTVLRVEVLSDGEWDWETLDDVAYAIYEGDCSGSVEPESVQYLSEMDTARELVEQGSAPSFLLGEAWEGREIPDACAADTPAGIPTTQKIDLLNKQVAYFDALHSVLGSFDIEELCSVQPMDKPQRRMDSNLDQQQRELSDEPQNRVRYALADTINSATVYMDGERKPVAQALAELTDEAIEDGDYCAETLTGLRDILSNVLKFVNRLGDNSEDAVDSASV